MDLDDPTAVALAAPEALRRSGAAHALYGGLLLAAYAAPRETRDADLAVAGASAEEAAHALASHGLSARVAFERTRFGGLWVSRITLIGGDSADGLNTVDLVEPRSIAYAERGGELDREAVDVELATLREELADEPIAECWSQVRSLV